MENKQMYNAIMKKMIKIEKSNDLNNLYLIQELNTIEWLYSNLNDEGKKVYLEFCYYLFNKEINYFYEKYPQNIKQVDLVNDFIFSYYTLHNISFRKLIKAYSDNMLDQARFLNALNCKLNDMDLSLYKPDCNLIKVPFIKNDKENKNINYNEENIEDVRKSIEEDKIVDEQGRTYRMVENPGVPCNVKVSETSRKTLAKSLLK